MLPESGDRVQRCWSGRRPWISPLSAPKASSSLAMHRGRIRSRFPYRRIARELGVHRETVSRYVQLAEQQTVQAEPEAKQATPPTGSDPPKAAIPTVGSEQAKPAISTAGSPGRRSRCDSFRQVIITLREQGLSAQRIWQALQVDHGFEGSYESVKRFVRRLGRSRTLPFRRMECEPGKETQIDFGTGAPILRREASRVAASDAAKKPSRIAEALMCVDQNAELPACFYTGKAPNRTPLFDVSPTGNRPVFAGLYRRMEKLLRQAVQEIKAAKPKVLARCMLAFDSEALCIRWLYHTVRTTANFCESWIGRRCQHARARRWQKDALMRPPKQTTAIPSSSSSSRSVSWSFPLPCRQCQCVRVIR